MPPEELNRLLFWALRFAFPATLLILWRRWVPGVGFLAYLGAASLWVWIYDPGVLWRVILASSLTSPLEIIATWEIALRFWDDEWHDYRRRIMRVIWTAGAIGASLALMLHSPSDSWTWYSLLRACVHIGCLSMLIIAGTFSGIDRMRVHRLHWLHAGIWTLYTIPAVAGVLIQVRIQDTEVGAEIWLMASNWIDAATLACLALWILVAVRVPRVARAAVSVAVSPLPRVQ